MSIHKINFGKIRPMHVFKEIHDNAEITNYHEYIGQLLLYNKHFKIEEQTVFNKSWYQKRHSICTGLIR